MRILPQSRARDVADRGRRAGGRIGLVVLGGLASTFAVASAVQAQPKASAKVVEPVRRPAPLTIRYAPRGLPARRIGAAVRGPSELSIAIVAPKDHLPETGFAHPSLYWRTLEPLRHPIEKITLTFTDVARQRTREYVLPGPTIISDSRDMQRLTTDSIALEEGREYLWRLRVELTNGATGTDAAYLRRRASASADEGDAISRARAAAADGRWYDALAALADSASAAPRSDVRLVRDRYVRESLGAAR